MVADWDRLDRASYRTSMIRSVRKIGWIMAMVGALLVAFAFIGPVPPLAWLGALLVAAGGWNFLRPSLAGMVVDGATMVLVGVALCAWRLWLADDAEVRFSKDVVGGLFMIWRGVVRLRGYRVARDMVDDPPAIRSLLALARAVARRDARHDEGIVELTLDTRFRHRNRFGLFTEGAVGLLEDDVVRLEKRSDIRIEPVGSTWLGRKVKVNVHLGELERRASMSREHLERFEHWKLGMAPATSIAA
jgi:hypothetical protein